MWITTRFRKSLYLQQPSVCPTLRCCGQVFCVVRKNVDTQHRDRIVISKSNKNLIKKLTQNRTQLITTTKRLKPPHRPPRLRRYHQTPTSRWAAAGLRWLIDTGCNRLRRLGRSRHPPQETKRDLPARSPHVSSALWCIFLLFSPLPCPPRT